MFCRVVVWQLWNVGLRFVGLYYGMFCLGSLGMSGSVTFSYVLLRHVKAVAASRG